MDLPHSALNSGPLIHQETDCIAAQQNPLFLRILIDRGVSLSDPSDSATPQVLRTSDLFCPHAGMSTKVRYLEEYFGSDL